MVIASSDFRAYREKDPIMGAKENASAAAAAATECNLSFFLLYTYTTSYVRSIRIVSFII